MALTKSVSGLLFTDDFNRANGAPGANYTIDGGTWAISGNKLVSTSGAAQGQIRLTGLAARKDFHVQLNIIKNHLSDYAVVCARVAAAGAGNYYILDLGAATDGTDPNKTRIYRATGGGFTRLGGGTAIGGVPVAGVAYRENATVKTGEQKIWINGTAGGATVDATVANDIVGYFLLSYVPQGGSANIQIDDLIICTSRIITFTGLPAGYKGRAGGVTSAASDGINPVTVDLAGAQLPLTLVEVIDAGSVVKDNYTVGDSYGGDTYLFVRPMELTAGGGAIAATGTVAENATIAATAGGGQISAVGTISMNGVMQMTGPGASINGTFGHYEDNPYPLGRREVIADFSGVYSPNISLLKRPDAISFDYLTAFSMGPRAIGDISLGATNRPWYVRVDNVLQKVYVAKATDDNTAWNAETILFAFAGTNIEEIDVAFDQSGNAVVCAERNSGVGGAKEVWLYWFKPALGAFTFEMLEAGRTPRILLDNPPDPTNSDIILFYLKTGVGLVYRIQREVYAVVHATPHVIEADWYVEDAFYTKGYRVAVFLSVHNPGGTYGKKRLETTLMPVFITHEDLKMVGFIRPDTGVLVRVLIIFTDDPAYAGTAAGPMLKEFFTLVGSWNASGVLAAALVQHVLYDIEKFSLNGALQDGALTDPGTNFLTHDLYDIDAITLAGIFAGTGTLAAALITHSLYDIDAYKFAGSFAAGGTLA